MSTSQSPITSVLKEARVFPPPPAFAARAHVKSLAEYEKLWNRAKDDPAGFWGEQAASLHWFKPWQKVLAWKEPHAEWFSGGRLNASYNCIDRHVVAGRGNKAAIIWEGEPGESRVLRYQDLLRDVGKFANVLKQMGVKAGDRVTLYMPMVPELVIAMLACAYRCPAQHHLRRLQCGRCRRAQQRRRGDAPRHRGWRLAPRKSHSAQAQRRLGPRKIADRQEMHRS